MGEGRGHVPSLESVKEKRNATTTTTATTATASSVSVLPSQEQHVVKPTSLDVPPSSSSSSPQPATVPPSQHKPDSVVVPLPQPSSTTTAKNTAVATNTAAPVLVRYRFQPGIYRFRCYGALTLHQKRPLETLSSRNTPASSSQTPPPSTTSHMTCQGIATQLELIEPFLHTESAQHQFFHHHHHYDGRDDHQRRRSKAVAAAFASTTSNIKDDQPPLKLEDLQHTDDVETFIEEQRAFVWTPHSSKTNESLIITRSDNHDHTTTTTTTTTTDDNQPPPPPSTTRIRTIIAIKQPNEVWNTWTSMGATEVDLLVSRREGALFLNQGSIHWHLPPTTTTTAAVPQPQQPSSSPLQQQPQEAQQTQPLPEASPSHDNVVPPPQKHDHHHQQPQQPRSPTVATGESQILGVLPKPMFGLGKHEVGMQKDGTFYRGTYSQISLFGILQIGLYRTDEFSLDNNNSNSNNTTNNNNIKKPLDLKTQVTELQAFWKKVVVNMKREVLFLKSEFSSDFGERWYKMSSRILEKVPKTAEKTAQTIVKFVRGYWPNDD